MSSLLRHPLSALFSHLDLKGQDLEDLAEDIKTQGLLSPITTHEGMVLDGWNRYTACQMAGVEPVLIPLHPGGDPWAFVKGSNMLRRHMSPAERVAVLIKKTRLDGSVPNGTPSVRDVAKDLEVGKGTAERAVAVMQANDPALEQALEEKRVSLDGAAKLAKMPVEERHAAMDVPKVKPEAKQPSCGPGELERLRSENEELKDRLEETVTILSETKEDLEAARRTLDAEDLLAQFNKEIHRANAMAASLQSRNNGLMNENADLKGRLKSALKKIQRLEKVQLAA